jgi:hypothetical protein
MRLDKERVTELQPQRMEFAKQKIEALGYVISFENETTLQFLFKGKKVNFFPYSGWHSGATIKDGRGINNLLKQIA